MRKPLDQIKMNFIKGFTLMETLITVGIVSGVLIVISFFGLELYQFNFFLGESLQAESDVQRVFKTMIAEMRSIGQSANGSFAIDQASSSSFSFYSDIDGDGLAEKVRYFQETGNLKKGTIEPFGSPAVYDPASEKISDFVSYVVSGNIFSYYNGDYDGTQPSLSYPIDPSVIRLVKVKLIVDRDPTVLPLPVEFSSFINIRNLRGI
ncbi:MAG: hypothetical protein Q8Q89_00445 [bacterium]|nr:hypothetical protein [bacterium]